MDQATTSHYQVTVGSRAFSVEVVESADGLGVRIGDGNVQPATLRQVRPDGLYALNVAGQVFVALVGGREGDYTVVLDGEVVDVQVQDERAARLASAAGAGRQSAVDSDVTAPMPGLVVTVNVEPGQAVSKGSSLIVLQAMKMENDLTARADATVKDVLVAPGQAVDQGQTLVTLE